MSVFDFISKAIDKLVPDAGQRAELQLRALEMEKTGHLKELESYLALLSTEAASNDNYTRRARPTALYIIYVLMCWGLFCSVVAVVSPEKAELMQRVFIGFFEKMPGDFYDMVMVMFGIYSGARTFEKIPGRSKKP